MKDKIIGCLAWINRRWVLCTFVLTIVFWIISKNILVGFLVGFFTVVLLIMFHAIVQLKQLDKK